MAPDSSQFPQDAGFWTAVAGALTAIAALFRRPSRAEIHKIRGELNEHVLKDERRLTALETIAHQTADTLGRIESEQRATNERLDRLIERGGPPRR